LHDERSRGHDLFNEGSLQEQELTDEIVTSAAAGPNNCHKTGPFFTCVKVCLLRRPSPNYPEFSLKK
jgi:hypothetical protein